MHANLNLCRLCTAWPKVSATLSARTCTCPCALMAGTPKALCSTPAVPTAARRRLTVRASFGRITPDSPGSCPACGIKGNPMKRRTDEEDRPTLASYLYVAGVAILGLVCAAEIVRWLLEG